MPIGATHLRSNPRASIGLFATSSLNNLGVADAPIRNSASKLRIIQPAMTILVERPPLKWSAPIVRKAEDTLQHQTTP